MYGEKDITRITEQEGALKRKTAGGVMALRRSFFVYVGGKGGYRTGNVRIFEEVLEANGVKWRIIF